MTIKFRDLKQHYDLVVIGGGINGVGIARDAAGRGLSVLLCEKDDLASHTSSASSKLIHGGLRYLEHYDFKLVRHSLIEREILLRSAPHIIWPLRFVLPHHKSLRPRWLIRLGLFIYDHLGGRKILPGSFGIDLNNHVAGKVLKSEFERGFEYSDCWVQDARLVVLNAMSARELGADIVTRTCCVGLDREKDQWKVQIESNDTGQESRVQHVVSAKAVVNAAGPWVEHVDDMNKSVESTHGVRLVKGSHIVVPKLFDHEYVYLFQNADDRIMFAIPFENEYTLLGTTDVEVGEDPSDGVISDQEIQYICEHASQYFRTPVEKDSIVYTYSGVRPLFDDAAKNASKATRDYVLHLNSDGPAIVSVFGGKLTTYRRLSEDVVNLLSQEISIPKPAWSSSTTLPGGDFDPTDFLGLVSKLCSQYSWCPPELIQYYARNYGTLTSSVLGNADSIEALGQHFAGTLYEIEVAYLYKSEWAKSADDILFRRTKVGITFESQARPLLEQWMRNAS